MGLEARQAPALMLRIRTGVCNRWAPAPTRFARLGLALVLDFLEVSACSSVDRVLGFEPSGRGFDSLQALKQCYAASRGTALATARHGS